MISFFVWMLTSAENVTEEARPIIEEQIEYRTRLSVAFQLFLPVAGLIFLIFKQKNIFNRLLLQLDRNCSVFCPSFSKREKLLKWASSRLPTTWSSTAKTLSGGITELWTDGSLLCTLINTAIPGACPNPYRHWKKPPTHAQGIAYKYFGIVPLFTEKELSEPLDPILERNFMHYLTELQKAISKLSETKDNLSAVSDHYITRGMGLFSGEQHRKTVFYIYVDDSSNNGNNSTILIQIRGPYGTFGKAIIPKFPNSLFNEPETDKSLKNFKPKSNFMKKFSLPFMKYHKKHTGDNITIDVIIEGSRARITYIPKNFGMYEINMVANGELLKGCPFNVHILKNTSGIKDSFELKVPAIVTYKTRKVISKTIDLVDETMPVSKLKEKYGTDKNTNEDKEKREMKKQNFNFDEVVKELSKNGGTFNNNINSKYLDDEKETVTIADVEFQLSNQIPTIEEVEEIIESELESGLGFSETISEISNENDDFRLYLESKRDSNFSSLESQDQTSTPEAAKKLQEVTVTQTDPKHDLDNINKPTDKENKQHAVKTNNTRSIFIQQHMIQNNSEMVRSHTPPQVEIREYANKTNINKVKIPERFSELGQVDSKFIKNVVNNSSKNQSKLKKYFEGNDKTNNKNVKVHNVTFEESMVAHKAIVKENGTANHSIIFPSRFVTDKKVINNSNELSVQKPSISNLDTEPSLKNVKLNISKSVNFSSSEKGDTNKSSPQNLKTSPLRRISSKEFLEQMLEESNDSGKKSTETDFDFANRLSTTKSLIEKFTKKNQTVAPYSSSQKHVDTKETKLVRKSNSSPASTLFSPTQNVPEEIQALKPSTLSNTSPICSSHIDSEVEFTKMSVDEKRKIFARKILGYASASPNSTFSASENAEVYKPQKHMQFEGLSVLNVLNSLKQSQSSPTVPVKRPLTSTSSLPNISTIDSEYVFPQLVKEKKHFWEDVTTKTSEKIPSNRKTRTVWVRSRTIDTTTENFIEEQAPNKTTTIKHKDVDFPNVVKEKMTFWEKIIPNITSTYREKQNTAWNGTQEIKRGVVIESTMEVEDSSLSSQEPSLPFSLGSSYTSLPNISFPNNGETVKQKKSFWEKFSSVSSSSLKNGPSKQNLEEHQRVRLIWAKPTPTSIETVKEEKSFDIYKSADDILSMTDYYPHQSIKRFKSMDDSLDNCTALTIEERKKMLLKQNYEKEQLEKERKFSLRKRAGSIKDENTTKKEIRKRFSDSSYFSPVVDKIRKFNSVSNLDLIPQEKEKIVLKREPIKPLPLEPKDETASPQKPKHKSYFKRAVKYFKNLEAKSLKPKPPDRFTTKVTLEIRHRRGGSLNFPKVSKRFSVSNLYDDVVRNRRGQFRGTPNRSALVEALATFSRKQVSGSSNHNEDEDNIKYEIFKRNIKTKRRKSLRSVFDLYY